MCSYTPRFSYDVLKTVICACPSGPVARRCSRRAVVYGSGWYPGGYTGWVPGGLYRGTTQLPGEVPYVQRSGPVGSCREPEWWYIWSRTPGAHPCGARSVLWPSLAPPRANPASGPIRARFSLFYTKLSQNGIVSPKISHKACHSPYSQNPLQNSPLKILGFLFSPAFSHKELIGPN